MKWVGKILPSKVMSYSPFSLNFLEISQVKGDLFGKMNKIPFFTQDFFFS